MESDVSRNIEEQLSAFLDGQLRDEEVELLVRRLEINKEYRATLARYSLIGNVLRNDPVQTYPDRFRAGIMAAISTDSADPAAVEKAPPAKVLWKAPLATAAAVLLLFSGLFSAGLFENLFKTDTSPAELVAAEPNVPMISSPPDEPDTARTARTVANKRGERSSLNPRRMTSYMVSHREYSQPLHAPIANSRIAVQQVRFED